MSLTDILGSVSAFAGVNPGYEGEGATIRSPEQAAAIIQKKTQILGRSRQVFPGRIVYNSKNKSAHDGEAIGAIFTPGDTAVAAFETVRQKLEQTTLSVITKPGTGMPSFGFVSGINATELRAVAEKWYDEAQRVCTLTGVFVSCAFYKTGDEMFAQAEANPHTVADIDVWTRSAAKILQCLQPFGKPSFRDVGFHYLR